MTSLLPPRAAGPRASDRPSADGRSDRQRPLALVASLGGVAAALAPLLVLAAVGVIGWFTADAGAHGTPSDGMRIGALAWLMGHGSGVTVQGADVGIVPLGVTAMSAWAMWRLGHRVGDAVSGHGPDADRIADGERDFTVPVAVALFFVGYAVVAVVVASVAASVDTEPSTARVVWWSLLMTLAVAAPAIAIGSGRAAIWAALAPAVVRDGVGAALSVLGWFLAASALAFVAALLAGAGDAATTMSQLHLSAGDAVVYSLVNAGLAPNAVLFSGSFLLGPGFAVGGGTMVSPGLVVLGPLPLLPLLAALPGAGATAGWVASLVAAPPVVAALATAWWQRRRPTLRWDHGALRGCGGGIVAGVAFAALASVAGGVAGPGRMQHVGPFVPDVLVHAITAFGVGGLVGGLVMTWWQRRHALESAG
ncbi:hypothetical protein ASG88_06160 [Nocardioides sp. Soil777]|uniref:cell division protein PerM n=1 Tax=Nocardioides sp. Soil777 TaxID=1736409 RepID=UPI0007029CD4|nr:DUF6350 family protein [Nocardioides sp. Soil777]KRF02938.1 hypothetical protein ASG88_06160 [Nocardioides sp. Soil777]